jgi:hypothetical protein
MAKFLNFFGLLVFTLITFGLLVFMLVNDSLNGLIGLFNF